MSKRKSPKTKQGSGAFHFGLKQGERLAQPLKNTRNTLTTAHTGSNHTVALVAAAHLIQQLDGQLRTGTTQRVTKGDGPTIGVNRFGVDTHRFDDGQRLGSEGFVEFRLLDVL
jgi:hypothetical protein